MPQQFIPYNRWLHQHDDDIRREYPDRPTEAMAKEMEVNYYTLSHRATRLGVSKSAEFMHTSWKKGSKKKGGWKDAGERGKRIETADKYMQEHFAHTKNETLAAHFGVDVKTIRRWARRLGLVKSETFMRDARAKGCCGNKKAFYTPEQIAWRNRRIAEVFPDADDDALQQLADELGVKLRFVYRLANQIGVKRNRHSKFTPQLVAAIAEYFPTHTDKECAAHFGINKSSIQELARKHGWKKSREHLDKIHDSNIKAAQEYNRMYR